MSTDDLAAWDDEAAFRRQFASLFENAPTFAAVVRGPDHVFDMANDPYLRFVERADIIGKPARVALPELVHQGFIALLDTVYASATPFIGKEMPILLDHADSTGAALPDERFRDFVYQPLMTRSDAVWGIFIHGVDVTRPKRLDDTLYLTDLELRQAQLDLQASAQRQHEFLSGLAKDLANPESPLRIGIQAVRRAQDLPAAKAAADTFDRQLGQLLRLVRMQLDTVAKTLAVRTDP